MKKTMLGAVSVFALLLAASSAASAAGWHGRDRHHDRGWHGPSQHRMAYHRHHYVPHDRVYQVVRGHGYRYVGNPYLYDGRYVLRAYDRHGRLVLTSVDPLTGAWLGVSLIR